MKKSAYSIAVVGATGLVGGEIVTTLEERQFPLADLRLYASPHSAGEEVQCGDVSARVELLDGARLEDTDIVFLAAGEAVSAEWAGRAADAGAVAIDLSQLYAADDDVPAVVPEINAGEIAGYLNRGVVTSPSPPALALAVVLKPLHVISAITRVAAVSLEPVSGVGRAGIEELQQQTIELMNGRSIETQVFPHRIAFNLLPHSGQFLAGGWSSEEEQTVSVLRRLLEEPELSVHITRVRTPLFFGTAIAATIDTAVKVTADQARETLRSAPGILLQDDVVTHLYPTPADTVGQDGICVGRIRETESDDLLDLWMTIDNIRKGAAVNAVQIAEVLIRDYL